MSAKENIIKLFGEDSLKLRSTSYTANYVNYITGKMFSRNMNSGSTFNSVVSSSKNSFKKEGEVITIEKPVSSRVGSKKVEGVGNSNVVSGYLRTTLTKNAEGKVSVVRHHDVTMKVMAAHMDDEANKHFKAKAVAELGENATPLEMAKYLCALQYDFEVYFPSLDKEEYSVKISKAFIPEEEVVRVTGTLLFGGEPIEEGVELPTKYFVSIRPSGDIFGVPKSNKVAQADFILDGAKEFTFDIATKGDITTAHTIGNNENVELHLGIQFKIDGKFNVKSEITQLEECVMLPIYDMFNLGDPEMELPDDYIIPNWNNFIHLQISDISNLRLPLFVYMDGKHVDYDTIKSKANVEFSIAGKPIEETEHNLNGLRITDVLNSPNGCVGVFPLTCKITYEGEVFERTLNTSISQNNSDFIKCDYGLKLSDLPSNEEQYYYLQSR